jgi:hypothetical protein
MTLDRRQFVTALVVSGAAAAVPARSNAKDLPSSPPQVPPANAYNARVDFRYAPHDSQSTICFPDDPRKTIVGQAGDLRYAFVKSLSSGMANFGTVVEFSLAGFQDDGILRQWIESPSVPIVHTRVDRPAATFELIAFATRHADEGRVDNVLLSIKSKRGSISVMPKLHIRTCERLRLESYTTPTATVTAQEGKSLLLVASQLNNNFGTCMLWEEEGFTLYLPHSEATEEMEARYFIRRDPRVLAPVETPGRDRMELPWPPRRISGRLRAQHSTSAGSQEWATRIPGWPYDLSRYVDR